MGSHSQVEYKSHFPGHFSMRDLNEDSNSSSWPMFYGDSTLMGGQFYNGYMPRNSTDAGAEYDKDRLKQKILEHEAIFKNQVYELHRLYRIQRDMMEDIRKKELNKRQTSIEASSSSSLRGDTKKWQFPSFPLANSGHPMTGVDFVSSPLSCTKGDNVHHASGSKVKDCEVIECRPSKVRKKLFDLQLPGDEYLDTEEGEPFHGIKMSNIISSLANGDKVDKPEKFFLNGCNGGRIDWQRDVSTSGTFGRNSMKFADLNEPVRFDDSSLAHKGKERDWLCEMYESVAGPKQDRLPLPSKPLEVMLNKSHHNVADFWREKTARTSEAHLDSIMTSQAPHPYPYMNPSELANSWSHSAFSLGKPIGSLTENRGPFHGFPTMNKTSQSSPLSHSTYGRSSLPPCSVDPPIANGIYHGSSSGSKDPSIRFSPFNRIGGEAASKGANYVNVKPLKDMDLNVVHSKCLLNEEIITQDVEIMNEKRNPLESLPWLRAKQGCRTESVNVCKIFSKLLDPKGTGTSSQFENNAKDLIHHKELPTEGRRRVIDINLSCEEEEEEDEEMEREVTRKRNHFDLNSCIDENVDEMPIESSFASQTSNKKIVFDIDLEAPIADINDDLDPSHGESLQSFEPKPEQVPDDLDQLAAEAIMSLSLSKDPLEDSLLRFADAICTFSDTIKETSGKEKKRTNGLPMDEFEMMTLQLVETKEEDYMPKPFVHEVQEMEESGGAKSVANRGRRGQTRRGGRQRRDFQRDILPGLASLSRQEVTEDLQMFSGLMKAMGQTWSSGLTRRNGARNGGGGGRGRRKAVVEKATSTVVAVTTPLVQQLTSIEASLEGWGKTTRRPRRQRCPPGNPPPPPAVTLT